DVEDAGIAAHGVMFLDLGAVGPAPSPIAPDAPALPQESARAGTANPASTYCLQRGGQLEFSTRSGGGEVGICVSPGGDECEEWAFLRGSCAW
ncbi:putative hemolysin, partial [Ralstonia pseudosolanacearum]|uniref:putative hemolysin n=1 Tax=Ralstonia pseudosolanacearum TaxID=1310165 RepID=UPI003221ADBD